MKNAAIAALLALALPVAFLACDGPDAASPGTSSGSSTAAAAAAGDGGAKSAETQDAEDFCNSEQRSGATGDEAKRARISADWMSKRVRTEWFRTLMTKTQSASLDPMQKDMMLRTDFADRGVTSCPTLDKRDPNAMH